MRRVFGIHAVSQALASASRDDRLLLQKGGTNARRDKLREQALAQGISVQLQDRTELDQLVEGNHQGAVLEIAASHSWPELDELLAGTSEPLILVLDSITDPRNLGACLRSAAAFGCSAVIAPKDASAPLNDVAAKTASGAADRLPYYRVTNLSRTLKQLKDAGLWVVGLALEGEQTLEQLDLTGPLVLVMGSEGSGIRRLVREHCDFLAHLPMASADQNLNVSVATGVSLYEAQRQRQ